MELERALDRFPVIQATDDLVHVLVGLVVEAILHAAEKRRHGGRIGVVDPVEELLLVERFWINWGAQHRDA